MPTATWSSCGSTSKNLFRRHSLAFRSGSAAAFTDASKHLPDSLPCAVIRIGPEVWPRTPTIERAFGEQANPVGLAGCSISPSGIATIHRQSDADDEACSGAA
jgi:hypothetical protein